MKANKIKYQGIARASSNQEIQDGWLDELINLRHRNEKLQPVPAPKKLYGLPIDYTFDKIWVHVQDDIENYIGLTDDYKLRLINMGDGSSESIKAYSSDVDVVFLKRFMIVVYNGGMDKFLYDNNDGYIKLSLEELTPQISMSITSLLTKKVLGTTSSESASNATALLGKYFEGVRNMGKDGYITGGIFCRYAIRMFDGSYVLHSNPQYAQLGNMGVYIRRASGNYYISFQGGNLRGTFTFSTLFSDIELDDIKKIASSVVVFACKNESLYEISEDTITDDNLEDWFDGDETIVLGKKLEVSENYKKMPHSPSWYKIGEISFDDLEESELIEGIWFADFDMDMKDFDQDYATREILPIDQFSHHSLQGIFAMNYNSRLILTDLITGFNNYLQGIKPISTTNVQKYEDGSYIDYEWDNDIACKIIIEIETASGIKTLQGSKLLSVLQKKADHTNKAIALKSVSAYPDSRAKKLKIYVEKSGLYYCVLDKLLKKNDNMNYAYLENDNFDPENTDKLYNDHGEMWGFDLPEYQYKSVENNYNSYFIEFTYTDIDPSTPETDDNEILDTNRMQISEVNNPFFFPSENSYQIGTGKIIAAATNTEPLSTGQYGEYPLIVFTTKGIWTLFQGQGDVLFSAVKPLNGEVAKDKDQIISTGTGITYSTDRGLYLIEGRKITDLTKLLKGVPNIDIQAVSNYILRLDHLSLVQIVQSLSTVDAKVYISGSKMSFDKKNNELLVSNNSYEYSYVFNFESGFWHKISESYRILINKYPETLVQRENSNNDGIFSISQEAQEDYRTPVQVVVSTRPCKLDSEANFTLLHRAIQHCHITTKDSVYAGFYVFGSNDMRTWQLLTGNDRKTGEVTDILTTRTHCKVKYYIFLFAAELKMYNTVSQQNIDNSINTLDIQFYHKLINKIR